MDNEKKPPVMRPGQNDSGPQNGKNTNGKPTPPKRPMIAYYLIVIAVLVIINLVVSGTTGSNNYVTEVSYSEFLTMLDQGSVKEVNVSSGYITFSVEQNGVRSVCKTGTVEDDTTLAQRLETAKVTFSKSIPQETDTWVTLILSWVLPLILFVILGQLLMRQMGNKMGGGMSFGKSNAKVYVAAQTGTSFADVAGEDEAKQALSEIVDFLHNPQKYKDIGAKMPKGALLVGPPGTGKTLLAKAVAGEANVPFFSISGSEFVEMFVGMGAARVRDLFKQAQEKAPCIVFIDEIDAIGKKREGNGLGGNDEREQTLNQLLTEMDGFDASNGVVILAATNRPETLDKALLRPGRFDRRVPVELPDLAGREAILRVHAKDVKMSGNINFRSIALATSGTSGAELANIINEGALLAVKEGRKQVEQRDLEEAIETVLAGYQRKGTVISAPEKRMISYHEIGHALVAASQKASAPVHKITIIPRTSGALGYTMQVEEDEHFLMTREEILNKITTLTAGRAAEELIFGEVTSGAANDIEQATKLARMMITRLGMSKDFDMTALEVVANPYLSADTSLSCSAETAAQIDRQVVEIIRTCHAKAFSLLQDNRDKLDELAAYLLEKETITGEEFMTILRKPRALPAIPVENDGAEGNDTAGEKKVWDEKTGNGSESSSPQDGNTPPEIR